MQGNRLLDDLTALQELRIGADASIENLMMHLEGLPPSIRRLTVAHGIEPPYRVKKLLTIAPPSTLPIPLCHTSTA